MNIRNNEFFVLGVSTRDNRTIIFQHAEEQVLFSENETLIEARNLLVHPKKRVLAEIMWFPGISPRKLEPYIQKYSEKLAVISGQSDEEAIRKLPVLCAFNLRAANLERILWEDFYDSRLLVTPAVINEVLDFADLFDAIDPDQVLTHINEDRVVAGIATISDRVDVLEALNTLKKYSIKILSDICDRADNETRAEFLTEIIEISTQGGEEVSCDIISQLIDNYEVNLRNDLDNQEAEIVNKLESLESQIASQTSANKIKETVKLITSLINKWDHLSQPMQVLSRSMGLDHEPSKRLGYAVRSTSIDIVNEHGDISVAKELTELSSKIFAELRDLADRFDEDNEALDNLQKQRDESIAQLKNAFPSFRATNETCLIKGKTIHFSDIQSLEFSYTRTAHSVNFVSTGETDDVRLEISLRGQGTVILEIDEEGFIFNKNKESEIDEVLRLHGYLCQITFEQRLNPHLETLQRNGYFDIGGCKFYPASQKLVYKNKEYKRQDVKLLKGAGYITIKPKESTFLQKATKSLFTGETMFSTRKDSDIAFHLLEKKFNSVWKS